MRMEEGRWSEKNIYIYMYFDRTGKLKGRTTKETVE